MNNLLGLAALALSTVFLNIAHAGKLGVYTAPEAGFDTHTFYYDDGNEVTIIDTQFVPALTQAMVDKIRSETDSKITRVIVTHPNPDKFNGLAFLHGMGVESISSEAVAAQMPVVHAYKKNFWVNTMRSFEESDYPKFENVETTFNGKAVVELDSGETLSLIELQNSGIAKHQVVVRVDATGDLIVGDLVHHNAHAWLEGGLVGGIPHTDLESWRAALTELHYLSADYPAAKVYGGRGEFVSVEEAVSSQREYLKQVKSIVDTYIVENRASLNSENDRKEHFQNLTKLVSQAFPHYKLPYMVQYSVYGLLDTRQEILESYFMVRTQS